MPRNAEPIGFDGFRTGAEYRPPWTPPYIPPYIPPAPEWQHDRAPVKSVSSGMKFWCVFCIIVNIFAAIASFASIKLSLSGYLYSGTELFIISGVVSLVAVIGFSILINGKKSGFFVLCVCGGLIIVVNLIAGEYGQAFIGLFAPLITWSVIRNSWANLK
jgi:hypothetical protein